MHKTLRFHLVRNGYRKVGYKQSGWSIAFHRLRSDDGSVPPDAWPGPVEPWWRDKAPSEGQIVFKQLKLRPAPLRNIRPLIPASPIGPQAIELEEKIGAPGEIRTPDQRSRNLPAPPVCEPHDTNRWYIRIQF